MTTGHEGGPCPVCGGALSVPVHRGVRDFEHGMPVLSDFDACGECGLVAQVPPRLAAELAGYYPKDYRLHVAVAGRRDLLSRLKAVQTSLQVARLSAFLPERPLPLLEIGCGGGHFLHALWRRGHTDLTGIDRPPELGQAFEGTSIRYRAQDLDVSLDLGGPFAAVLMNYAIEHFESPEAVLSACRRALSPGGRTLLLTPNAGALSHSVFGRYWSGLHAPRHTQIFNPDSLQRLARKVGFAGAELVYGTDLGSWTLSFQNFVESRAPAGRPPRAGTAWYSLALLPAWYPFALVERLAGRSGAMFAILTV